MPLARIDLRKGKSADYLQRVGEAIYQAMRAVGVPENDRFQIFQQHDAGTLIYDPGYLSVDRTDDFICIQITWNEGRTLEQKKALYAGIADGLHAAVGIRREDVFINLVDETKQTWSFGNGVAQYVSCCANRILAWRGSTPRCRPARLRWLLHCWPPSLRRRCWVVRTRCWSRSRRG